MNYKIERLVRPSRRSGLAREFFELNPGMTWREAVDEADMWLGYLLSPFHLKPNGILINTKDD